MATPVKNFTDPTGTPFRMLDSQSLSNVSDAGATIPSMIGNGVMIALQVANFDTRMFTVLQSPPRTLEVTNDVKSVIPPPPMGRQILLTFPPIYKERGASSNRRPVGQQTPRYEF